MRMRQSDKKTLAFKYEFSFRGGVSCRNGFWEALNIFSEWYDKRGVASTPGWGDTHLKLGYGYVPPLTPSFHAFQAVSKDPHFIIFQCLKVLHLPEITNFWKICISGLKIGKIQFISLKFDQISVPRASNWTKSQFFKTSNLAADHSLSPYFRPFGPHIIPKLKLSTPWLAPFYFLYFWHFEYGTEYYCVY